MRTHEIIKRLMELEEYPGMFMPKTYKEQLAIVERYKKLNKLVFSDKKVTIFD